MRTKVNKNEDGYYLVTITETLKKTVKVKADNKDKAQEIVEDIYQNVGIVLDYDNFDDVYFSARKHKNENLDLYEEIKEGN